MTVSSRASLLAGILLLLVPRAALADPPASPPTEEQVEAGRELYKQALELQRDGKTRAALDRALEAYRVAPTPVTAVLTALLLEGVGRLVEAREIARGVSGMPQSPRETDKGREARQQAAVVAASLDARIPKIAVAGAPSGATVLLDGRSLGTTDSSAWRGVDPGTHALLVRLGDRTCTSVHLTLGEGEERTIDLHDVAASCPQEASPTPVVLPTPQPTATPGPSPGSPTASSPAPTSDEGRGWRAGGIILGAAGVLSVGIGTVLALSAKSDYDSVSGECPPVGCNQDGFDTRNDARTRGDIATVLIGAGAAAVAGGALMWWLAPSSSVKVSVGVGSVGVRF
jgi:hypothetical protein